MRFIDYQIRAISTATYPKDRALEYLVPALGEEVGELFRLFAKTVRDCGGTYQDVDRQQAMKEAGDILWMLNGICVALDFGLDEVAQANLDKLASRKARNVLHGNGDSR